ncbi:MAG: hypothetical protein IOD05_13895 [Rhodobacter sp.]|uniref:hypothetical protein n=1 Tax=Phenylobacterium sp. TaxID=1871053 RepID=UPI0025DB33AD|nr:hypothetical protein [Phenylobacterium sp.]MCA3504311.1 hypothetical protein [Rhodobacter sp.]MCA3640443.1 hypothetical protein [Methylobacterium sp.]MCA3722557.1 hypothetical protein [Phenylobacterium sp.]MCA6261569.1 hypothetical protein [Phenylobacterium sp.]MCA6328232.1 hypothetical protein [Phenylobacterium sp.]
MYFTDPELDIEIVRIVIGQDELGVERKPHIVWSAIGNDIACIETRNHNLIRSLVLVDGITESHYAGLQITGHVQT